MAGEIIGLSLLEPSDPSTEPNTPNNIARDSPLYLACVAKWKTTVQANREVSCFRIATQDFLNYFSRGKIKKKNEYFYWCCFVFRTHKVKKKKKITSRRILRVQK